MPRYRFSWDNVSDELVDSIAVGLGLKGDARAALRLRYGARPKVDFVRETWPILLDAWLAQDDSRRTRIVARLHQERLGDQSIPLTDVHRQLEYLRSCKNAPTLRSIVIGEFHSLGEPATVIGPSSLTQTPDPVNLSVSTGEGSGTGQPDNPTPTTDTAEPFKDWVLRTLAEALKTDIEVDDDGDIPIWRGSSVTYVRVEKDAPVLHLFSPAVREMRNEPSVYEAVNEINLQLVLTKAMVVDDGTGVVFSATVPADSISAQGMIYALDDVTSASDWFDDRLVDRFGGTTVRPNDPPDAIDV
jgi:hypothetical protein